MTMTMAMALNPAVVAQFRELFDSPSIDTICLLAPGNAEKFIQYVFESAGFVVNDVHTTYYPEGPGVDLTLCSPRDANKPLHFVEVKRWANAVGPEPVQAFGWKLQQHGVTGYFVALRGFTPAARMVATHDANIMLIDGEHLQRYIAYLSRSRVDRAYASIQMPLAEPAGPVWLLHADKLLAATPEPPARARILSVANNKGGVGKSTTARCVGVSLAKKGQRVLLIDMDAQANLTEFFLGEDSADDVFPHLACYFVGAYPLHALIRSVPGQQRLHIIPGHLDLGPLDTGGAGHPDVELRFAADLYHLARSCGPQTHEGFDWVVLDTPPAISLYTRAALATADRVVAPARARGSSARGTNSALSARHAMNALVGRRSAHLGCVITHWQNDQRSHAGRRRLEIQVTGLGGHLFTTVVPLSAAVESPQPPVAIRQAYDALVEEVLQDVHTS
jgi:chromosome partitioning protein